MLFFSSKISTPANFTQRILLLFVLKGTYFSSELPSLPYYLKRLQSGLYIVATLYLEAG